MKPRSIQDLIIKDLHQKMVFIAGPRQVGKTTLSKAIGSGKFKKPLYINWDHYEHRRMVLEEKIPSDIDLLIFDEIHKYPGWKNLVKGLYDVHHDDFSIIVTGSARLDVYRRGGDSMMGRYFLYRLHPLSIRELLHLTPQIKPGKKLRFPTTSDTRKIWEKLFTTGGFPEPYWKFSKGGKVTRRWQMQRKERLVREDIRDVEKVSDLSRLELLMNLLPGRASSTVSLNNLAGDLEVNHRTMTNWMNILERFYYHFRISPLSTKLARTLKKEQKLYLWDWSEVEDPAHRMENVVASHLLKMCHYLQDAEGHRVELWYVRDREKREVDFLVTYDKKPWFAVEVKKGTKDKTQHLKYFSGHLDIPFLYQVVLEPGIDHTSGKVRIMSVDRFLAGLV